MPTISSNSIALTILQQGARPSVSTAADTIVAIASGAKDVSKTAQHLREAGEEAKGISSVQSDADLSTIGRIVSAITLANAPFDSASVTGSAATDWESASSTAYGNAYSLIYAAIGVNGKFHLKDEINLDELLGKIEAIRTDKIANGVSEAEANKWADTMVYIAPGNKLSVEMQNAQYIYASEIFQHQMSDRETRLGVGKVLSTDAAGHLSVGAFEMKDGSGAKLVSLDDQGTLTVYNRDGSIRTQQTKAELLGKQTGYVLDAKRAGVDLQTANFY